VAFAAGAWGGTLPAVFGHEASGIVAEVGPDVRSVKTGDRVVISLLRACSSCFFCTRGQPHLCEAELPADREGRLWSKTGEPVLQAMHTGAFAEEVVVHESQLAVVPESLPLDVASLLGCAVVTGVGAVLDRAAVSEGESVVVIGTGGVGLNTVQAAVLCRASPVVAVDVSPEKLAVAQSFGATHTADAQGADAEVRELTEGRGADYVFVTVGRASAIEQGLALLRRGGTLVVVGMPPSGETFEVSAVDFVHDDLRILGTKMGSAALAWTVPRLVELYEERRLKLEELITARYPLEEINVAIAASASGESLRNVVVFDSS
jgi:S-(hydroxymethyl)glutathione dehydrogenase/alcohol dehydrogenase